MSLAFWRRRLQGWLARTDPYVVRDVGRRYRKGMKFLWWYGIFISMSSAFVDSFVTLYVLALGATNLQVGTLSSLASLFGLLMPLPGAQWAAHLGKRKPVVLISFGLRRVALFVALALPLLIASPQVIPWVIGFFALRAAFMHLGNSSWTSLAGDTTPPERRGRYFASRKSAMALATLICVPLAGQLIGLFAEPRGYQVAFLFSIAFGALALYLYAQIPEYESASGAQNRPSLAFWKVFSGNPTFLRFTLISMLFNFAWQFAGPYFSVYQVEVLGATAGIIGWLTMASSFMRIISQRMWGRAIDRRSSAWAFSVSALLLPLLPFIWLPLTAPWQLIFVFVPSGLLWSGRETASFNLLFDLAGEEEQMQAIAGYNTLLGLANILGPLIGGQAVQWLGYRWTFAISGFGRLIAAVLFLWLLKPFRLPFLNPRREPPAQQQS